jgi:hypothetical protein
MRTFFERWIAHLKRITATTTTIIFDLHNPVVAIDTFLYPALLGVMLSMFPTKQVLAYPSGEGHPGLVQVFNAYGTAPKVH